MPRQGSKTKVLSSEDEVTATVTTTMRTRTRRIETSEAEERMETDTEMQIEVQDPTTPTTPLKRVRTRRKRLLSADASPSSSQSLAPPLSKRPRSIQNPNSAGRKRNLNPTPKVIQQRLAREAKRRRDEEEEDSGDARCREESDAGGNVDGDEGRDERDEGRDERGHIVFEDAPSAPSRKKRKSKSSSSKPRKNAADPQRFSFSVTIAEDGQDFDIQGSKVLLQDFINNHTEIANVCVERGEADQHLHWQGMMIAITTTPQAFKKDIEKGLNYGSAQGECPRPVGLSISLRKLTGQGLHTKHGIIGYSRKQQNEPHFEELSHNISNDDRSRGDLEYLLHGKFEVSKNRVPLNMGNLINKMAIFMKFKTRCLLRHTNDPIHLILKMIRSGHYEVGSNWIYDRRGLDVERLRSLWRFQVEPENIEVQDILTVMFPHSVYDGDAEIEDSDSNNDDQDFENLTDLCASMRPTYMSRRGQESSSSRQPQHGLRYFQGTRKERTVIAKSKNINFWSAVR